MPVEALHNTMKFTRREMLLALAGLLLLAALAVAMTSRAQALQAAQTRAPDDGFALPEGAAQPVYLLDGVAFSTDRARKTVKACDARTGAVLWESSGEDRFIIPGAAFPIDLSPDGELWAANVGRKRLEQLDPGTGKFIASWEPREPFGGCCNPVRFAALAGGRFVTMEKGVRRACIYLPSGELEKVVTDELSDSEFHYFLFRDGRRVLLYDTSARKHWEVPYDLAP